MVFFFFNDTATTEIYTLSLHDALPIFAPHQLAPLRAQAQISAAEGDHARLGRRAGRDREAVGPEPGAEDGDRKSTRLNSSHLVISYAGFCLRKERLPRGSSGQQSNTQY